MFGVLWRKPGLTFFAYLIGYAVMRFFLTYLRIDSSETVLLDLRVPQLVSLLTVLASLPAIWYFATREPFEEPAPVHRIPLLGRLLGAER
ncbi:MAG: prolipoprotein diacylglyceryl transferase [Chloroflexi bacterium]|nr:prolipoprotein diacylglyceryl transferase [Chloroflexota bacterium]